MNPRTTNSQSSPADCRTIAMSGEATTPTKRADDGDFAGPTGVAECCLPGDPCRETEREPADEAEHDEQLERRAQRPTRGSRRRRATCRSRRCREPDEGTGRRPTTRRRSPPSCAVDVRPAVPIATSYCSATDERKNGVAVNTAVLVAMATRSADGTVGLAAARSRTGTDTVLLSRRIRAGVRRVRRRSRCAPDR